MTEASAEDGVLNNPAARLLHWLGVGRVYAVAAEQDRQQAQARNGERTEPYYVLDVWCHIWDLSPASHRDRIEYQRRAMGLIQAGEDVRDLAAKADSPGVDIALESFHEVEAVLGHFMDAPNYDIGVMMGKIGGTGWQSLRVLDKVLAKESPEPVLDGDQIADLLQQTNDLIAAVSASGLDEADKQLLTDKLYEVARSLTRARITGTSVVLNAGDGLTGALVRLQLRGVKLASHPVTQGLVALVHALHFAVGLQADVHAIGSGPLGQLFALPGPDSPQDPPPPPN